MNHSDDELLDRLRKAAEQLLSAYDAMDDALREGLPVGRTPQRRLTAACALIQVPERRLLDWRHSGVPRLRLQVQTTPNDARGADNADDVRLAMVIEILADAFNDRTVEPTEVFAILKQWAKRLNMEPQELMRKVQAKAVTSRRGSGA